ncbi:MAG: S8 family serine peptidase, partial [Nanoarchaeota archaeon]
MDSVPLINADDVWQMQVAGTNLTGEGVTIGIIDTGVDYTHPDLGGCFGLGCKVAGGWDFVNDDPDPMDDAGHGTHVASIAAGNGILKGVAPEAKIYAYKVLDSGGYGYDSDVIAAINMSIDPNQDGDFSDSLDIISMSLGFRYSSFEDCYEIASSSVVDDAVDLGISVVIAAGNDYYSQRINAPGCAKNVVTVGATDKNDNIAYFSSRGPTKDFRVKPDVLAPGVEICAARWDSYRESCIDNEHASASGTSMATPHVSGAIALIKQKHPTWTPYEIKHALRNTAIDVGENILAQGYGRIDVLEAVQLEDTPPVAILNTYGKASGIVYIIGTASGESFLDYFLEYGKGDDPDTWNMINASSFVVLDDFLGSLDTNSIQDGLYTIKLTARTISGESEERSIIIVVNDENNCYTSCDCKIKLEQDNSFVNLATDLNLDGDFSYCIPFELHSNNSTLDCNDKHIKFNPGSFYGYGKDLLLIYGNNINVNNCVIENSFSPIILVGSENTSIFNNTINESAAAIQIDYETSNARIENNKMINGAIYNFMVFGSTEYEFNHIVIDNYVNNYPLIYLFAYEDHVIENQLIGELICAWCENVTIINNTLDGTDRILIIYTKDSNVQGNHIRNTNAGIWLKYSDRNTVKENSVLEANSIRNAITRGMVIIHGEGNVLSKNTVANYTIDVHVWGYTNNLTFTENNLLGSRQYDSILFPDLILDNAENSTVKDNDVQGIFLTDDAYYLSGTRIYHNTIRKRDTQYYGNHNIFSNFYYPHSFELSHQNQGNFWNRNEEPYFCQYGNQNPNCIDTWDSDRGDLIDSCPYDQSYPLGEWPASPVCEPFPCENGQQIGDVNGDGTITEEDAESV